MHRAGAFFLVCAGLLGLALPLPRAATAAWPTDPLVNVPLCIATGDQERPEIVLDGVGGTIVTWQDARDGCCDIYAQRISGDGTAQWSANGVALCTATGEQGCPVIVSDGAGGAIATWIDTRGGSPNGDLYAQRISSTGTTQWMADGAVLCTAPAYQYTPKLMSDGAGGAIVTWWDERSGNYDIYAQRISGDGTVQWPADGVALCTAAASQYFPALTSDGADGAIVTWSDYRSGNGDIYAQRVSGDGTVQWSANGVALCTATGEQYYPTLVADGAGGAIVTWGDERSGNYDIYAQRISGDGDVQWSANGVALCTAPGEQHYPRIVSDGAGGAIVTWSDYRSGNRDIYAQRVSGDGTVQWSANGVALCTAIGTQQGPAIVSDGAAGAVVSWWDYRSGNCDVYAQRVSGDGTVQWPTDGAALCTATGEQYYPTLVADGAGGAIAVWQEPRSGNWDIYAQSVKASGELGSDLSVPAEAVLSFALEPVCPNPSRGGALTVHFTLPSGSVAWLELLDVAGRRIAMREVGSLGAGRHTLDLGEGRRLAPGLYLVWLTQGTSTRTTRAVVLR